MSVADASQYARAAALMAAGLPLPVDVASWVLRQLADGCSGEEARALRNEHLRAAGRIVGGSARRRAAAILEESRRIERRAWRDRVPELGTFSGEVLAAMLLLWPLPAERQLREVLGAIPEHARLAVLGVPTAQRSTQHWPHEQSCAALPQHHRSNPDARDCA